jgi:hypothetical protein
MNLLIVYSTDTIENDKECGFFGILDTIIFTNNKKLQILSKVYTEQIPYLKN